MLYQRYQSARDGAWRTLIRYQADRLPVDVEEIARKLGIAIVSAQGEALGPWAACSLRQSGVWRICVRPHLPYSRYRFAVAHELGHLILQHKTVRLAKGLYTFEGRENAGDVLAQAREEADTDADMFAIRLLAPACVLHSMQVQGTKDIGDLCGLPEGAAAMRAERMQLLNARNAYFTHPLEKQLQRQFLPYIQEKSREQVPQAEQGYVPPLVLPERKTEERAFALPLWVWLAAAGAVLLALIFLR